MIVPNKAEVVKYMEAGYKHVPIYLEMMADTITPMEALRVLKKQSDTCFLLESAEANKTRGRYTFIGYQPKVEIVYCNQQLVVKQNGKSEIIDDDPRVFIEKFMQSYQVVSLSELPFFSGGLVGYFSFEYSDQGSKQSDGNDIDLMLFESVIVFDQLTQKIYLVTHTQEDTYETSCESLKQLRRLLIEKAVADIKPLYCEPLQPTCSKEEYERRVGVVKDHISTNAVEQVVLAMRWEAKASGSLFDVYRLLRMKNPSPYMFYLSGKVEIVGASPETLVRVKCREVSTYPLAGTRRRGVTKQEDEQLERELLADPKESMEHDQLVKLGIEDLSKVCQTASVGVSDYRSILRYSHVMHIGSTVYGKLDENKSGLDALYATIPAGTLSGAPRPKAMELIRQLEKTSRGIYGGAIGYIDFHGNMDMCIAIRLVYKKADTVVVQAGAGIVCDSIAKNEYKECQNKAKVVLLAIEEAQGGIL